MYSCAITGHRPTRFKFKYNENDSRCKRLKKCLKEQFIELYKQGVRRFLVGGALGVDYEKRKVMRSEVLDAAQKSGRQRNHFA